MVDGQTGAVSRAAIRSSQNEPNDQERPRPNIKWDENYKDPFLLLKGWGTARIYLLDAATGTVGRYSGDRSPDIGYATLPFRLTLMLEDLAGVV